MPPRAAAEQVRFRIVILEPPPGVRWALQLGRDELVPPTHADKQTVVLEGELTLGPPRADGTPTFRGAAAQGPVSGRFLYANSGPSAGAATAPWTRRAKIQLGSVTAELVEKLRCKPQGVLEARIAGRMRDGTAACATVPLVDGGWQVAAE